MNSPIKRHGGKFYLASKIVDLMPPRDGSWNRYVEPYFGSGAVLFAMDPEGVSEYANDVDGELMHFWEVLQDDGDALLQVLTCTPVGEDVFADACFEYESHIMRAAAFFIRNRQSRQALGRDYVTPTSRTRRGMNEQVSAWLSAVDGLPEAVERLRRVEVWNRPALEVIQKLDSPQTVFYLDPPYLHETRSTTSEYGEHEMTANDHDDLLLCLSKLQGRFLLSGYASDLYDGWERQCGWHRHEFTLPNNASSKATKERKVECVWTNYEATA